MDAPTPPPSTGYRKGPKPPEQIYSAQAGRYRASAAKRRAEADEFEHKAEKLDVLWAEYKSRRVAS